MSHCTTGSKVKFLSADPVPIESLGLFDLAVTLILQKHRGILWYLSRPGTVCIVLGPYSKHTVPPSSSAMPPHTTINWGIFKNFPNHKFIINLCSIMQMNLGELVLIEKNIIPKF